MENHLNNTNRFSFDSAPFSSAKILFLCLIASVSKLPEGAKDTCKRTHFIIILSVQFVTFLVLRQYLFSCQWTTRCLSEYSRIATFHFVHRSKAGAPTIMIFILLSQLFLPGSMCCK